MMMLTSLLVIASYMATEEAMIRLAYHISLLTGAGWVMELLVGHPMHIHTELGVSQETFIALIEELCGMDHNEFCWKNNWLFFSMPVSQGWLFSSWVRDFKDLMKPFQSIQIIFISKYWCWKPFRYFKEIVIIFSFTILHQSCPTQKSNNLKFWPHFEDAVGQSLSSAPPSYQRPFH